MKLASGLLIALMISCGTIALAQPAEGHGAMGHRPGAREQFMDKLKLSDAQKSDIMKLRTSMEKAMIDVQAKIKLARVDLRTLATADPPDRSAVESKIKEINDLQFQSKKVVVDHLFDVYNLLTPEQRKTFKDHMTQTMMNDGWRSMLGARRGMPGMRHPMGGGGEQE